jgi:ATP-dependent Clp protease protease subunit
MVIKRSHNGDRAMDIYSLMLDARIIFLNEPIDDGVSAAVIAQLLYLNSENDSSPINLYVNSPGGVISSGLAIIDTMNYIKAPVHTLCIGSAASMAAVILACGAQRAAMPHARIMIHQPLGGAQGQATDIEIQAAEIKRVRLEMEELLASKTGQTVEKIHIDTERDNYMNAKEALAYGLIDKIM